MRLISLLIVSLLLGCSASSLDRQPSAAKPTKLNVIATTDFHGAIDGEEGLTADGQKLTIGGAAVFAAYLKQLKRNLTGPTIWIDAGDLFQGSMVSNRYEGAPVVRMFNHLGLNAAALGNHEFDYGPAGEKSVPRVPSDDPRGALKARIKEAKFPFLAANVQTDSGQVPDWLKPSLVMNVQGLRVGIVGGASPGTPGSTNALNLTGLVFKPLLPSIRNEAERLRREEKVDVVIVTMHVGSLCEDNDLSKQEDLTSCNAKDSESMDFAKALPPGLVDLVIAGHTHRGGAKRVNNLAVLQTFSNGKYVGWATVDVASHTSRVEGLAPVCEQVISTGKEKTCDPYQIKKAKGAVEPAMFFGERIVPDAAVTKLLAPEVEKVRELKEASLDFNAADEFTRAYDKESALGNLVADATRESFPGADLGLTNGGGLRANLAAGPVTYGDIFTILPFDNQLATMKISGQHVYELARVGLFGGSGVFTWSSNLQIVTEGCEVSKITVDGQPLDRKRVYTVATSDYLAGGGSGVRSVKIPPSAVEVYWDAPYILRDLVVKVLKNWHRDIRSTDFYRADNPRQRLGGQCAKAAALRARDPASKDRGYYEHGHKH